MPVTKERFNPKRLKAPLCWMLLYDGSLVAALSLLTVFKSPLWLGWVVGMVVPECALWLAILTLCFAAAAWLLRRGHAVLTVATFALCGVAFVLMLKLTAQAWRLGRTLPA